MSVKINISSLSYCSTDNQNAVEVDGSTIGECLQHLITKFPGIKKSLFDKEGKLVNYIAVYVNGVNAYPNELAKPVKDGDELYILPIYTGG